MRALDPTLSPTLTLILTPTLTLTLRQGCVPPLGRGRADGGPQLPTLPLNPTPNPNPTTNLNPTPTPIPHPAQVALNFQTNDGAMMASEALFSLNGAAALTRTLTLTPQP